MRRWLWLRWGLLVLLVVLTAGGGVSRALRSGRVHAYLAAKLEAAFGRPVEIGRFDFRLLPQPALEADYITVSEDPRFGFEYFLRAERMTGNLRWGALLRGRFEFGTLAFSRPSLNLVRDSGGHWNIESWLPPPGGAALPRGPSPLGRSAQARLYRIEVDSGRINFKRGVDKRPFALADVHGVIEQTSSGRWRMDLEALPVRAAVELQDVGMLRVRGTLGGTSARLQPANLLLTWEDVSLADALRLASGQDLGMRGRVAVELAAQTVAPASGGAAPGESAATAGYGGWEFNLRAHLRDVHAWDLPQKTGDPALNILAAARWSPGVPNLEFTRCEIEGSQSRLRVVGGVDWRKTFEPRFQIVSSTVSAGDLLGWYRAFRPGVAPDVSLDGYAGVDVTLRGWPPSIVRGGLASDGIDLHIGSAEEPIHLGRAELRVRHGKLLLFPATITFGVAASGSLPGAGTRAARGVVRAAEVLHLKGTLDLGPGPLWAPAGSRPRRGSNGLLVPGSFSLVLNGRVRRAEDLRLAAQDLGYHFERDWRVEGAADLHLEWRGRLSPWRAALSGTIGLEDARLRAPYLNQPVHLTRARIEIAPGERRIKLASAQGFGARWTGSIWWQAHGREGQDSASGWEFDLSADHLDAAELDRWLGPRARPGFLQRVFPFAMRRSEASQENEFVRLKTRGRLHVERFSLQPLELSGVTAQAEIIGRNITLRRAHAQFYGGVVRGSLRAALTPVPSYRFEGQFEQVNLSALSAVAAALSGRFSGLASGEAQISAEGVGRASLLRSLDANGTLHVREAFLKGWALAPASDTGEFHAGNSQFASVDASFTLSRGKVRFDRVRLVNPSEELAAEGTVDFSRTLDFSFRRLEPLPEKAGGSLTSRSFRLTGPLDAPQIRAVPSAPRDGAKPSPPSR